MSEEKNVFLVRKESLWVCMHGEPVWAEIQGTGLHVAVCFLYSPFVVSKDMQLG